MAQASPGVAHPQKQTLSVDGLGSGHGLWAISLAMGNWDFSSRFAYRFPVTA